MAEENHKHCNASMDPSKPLAVYTKKQECCQAFVTDASNLIRMMDMVQMEMTHAVATGVMCDAYHKCKCIPKLEQTWSHWKEHFNDVLNELKELNAITAESMGYGANNITEQVVATDVVMALDNFASMVMSKTDALDILVAANKQFADALAHVTKENEKLLNMISQLTKDSQKPKQHKYRTLNKYCWTHGFIMSAKHKSKMCNNKAPCNKVEATKDNTIGGTWPTSQH